MPTEEADTHAPLQRLWRSRSLRFLLPIKEGERLAVVGGWPDIVRSAHKAGISTVWVRTRPPPGEDERPPVEVVRCDGSMVPLPDGDCDHVIVPCLRASLAPLVPAELARIIRPGGSVLLGAPWRPRAPRSPVALTVGAGRRLLRRAGFEDVRAYGVAPSLQQPRHIVPVDAHNALRWHAEAAYLPRGARGIVVARALRRAPGRLPQLLFPAVVFVARRSASQRAGR